VEAKEETGGQKEETGGKNKNAAAVKKK